jgi:hypothetical protein
MLALLLPIVALATEIDLVPSIDALLPLAGAELRVTDGVATLHHDAGVTALGHVVLEPPVASADGTRAAWVHRDGGVASQLSVAWRTAEGWHTHTRSDLGTPDRLAISADGSLLAWVSASPQGIAAVFVAPLEGGAAVQLTNVGLQRDGIGPPEGFVPPPHAGPLAFDGAGHLVWSAPDGSHFAALPAEDP